MSFSSMVEHIEHPPPPPFRKVLNEGVYVFMLYALRDGLQAATREPFPDSSNPFRKAANEAQKESWEWAFSDADYDDDNPALPIRYLVAGIEALGGRVWSVERIREALLAGKCDFSEIGVTVQGTGQGKMGRLVHGRDYSKENKARRAKRMAQRAQQ